MKRIKIVPDVIPIAPKKILHVTKNIHDKLLHLSKFNDVYLHDIGELSEWSEGDNRQ